MIVFDCETTGLVRKQTAALVTQPHIIEFGAIKVDTETLEEIGRLNFLVNPRQPLDAIITKITGITDDDLKDKKVFYDHYEEIKEFFKGEDFLVAHNAQFDSNLLKFELMRAGKEDDFEWPKETICTVELTSHLEGYRLSLTNLWERFHRQKLQQTHRAVEDCEVLLDVIKHLRKEELI
jgi:DNA polymerase-3 subunit epsilon